MKSKHQQVLERVANQAGEWQRDCLRAAKVYKDENDINESSVWQREADEAQERAEAIRHALEVMAKAETLPKTVEGYTMWPGGTYYRIVGKIHPHPVEIGFTQAWADNGRYPIYQLIERAAQDAYSTEQATRDAAEGKAK